MEMMREIPSGERLNSKENSILNDIKQETRDTPGYKALTETELMEKVEIILLDKIKNGERKANFQLGLFYFEQVCTHFCLTFIHSFDINDYMTQGLDYLK